MKLYATIVEEPYLDDKINVIKNVYKNKIFVFSSLNNQNIITFQAEKNIILQDIFVINRNKDTNTLFTINALNYLIKQVNAGVVDTSIRIQWEAYRNCILVVKDGYLHELPTKLKLIID